MACYMAKRRAQPSRSFQCEETSMEAAMGPLKQLARFASMCVIVRSYEGAEQHRKAHSDARRKVRARAIYGAPSGQQGYGCNRVQVVRGRPLRSCPSSFVGLQRRITSDRGSLLSRSRIGVRSQSTGPATGQWRRPNSVCAATVRGRARSASGCVRRDSGSDCLLSSHSPSGGIF